MTINIEPYIYHCSKRIFVKDIDKSLDFYKRIGFTRRYLVLDYVHYLSLGNINLELWVNHQNITVPKMHDDTGHEYIDPILFINVRDHASLHIVHDKIIAQGVMINKNEIDNDSSPYGENFSVNDPDEYKVVFRTLKNISNVPREH